MRVLVGIAAVAGLGIWVLVGRDSGMSPGGRAETELAVQGPGAQGSGQVGSRVIALPATTPANATQRLATAPAAIVPAAIEPAPPLPPTLELVSIPTIPGAKPEPPRTISRADAVKSVMRSREFQETVPPLARLYLATFGRYPDYDGLNYYTGQREEARPLHEIATEFTRSREFEARYGTLDNAQFVELLFTNVLGNPSQADVRGFWVEELDTGRMTRGQVLVDLAESGAFRERSAAQVFVATAYSEILHRTPDPAGFAYWVGQLQAGASPASVINGLLTGR